MTSSVALSFDDVFDIDESIDAIARAVERCDRAGTITPAHAVEVLDVFDVFVHGFDLVIRELAPAEAARVGNRVLERLLPLMRRAENGYRWYQKPRGYAGDYLTIARMYDDDARGDGEVGALIDRCFLRLPAARAVQNRRALLTRELRAAVRACDGRPARVTSLAAGPARELFDTFQAIEASALRATLIDFDAAALEHCAAECDRRGVASSVALVNANLIHVAIGRSTLALADQDFIYSIGLIDYFDDALVVKLLDVIHAALRPGGRVMLGNFHPRNPTRAVMDHVLDWKLVHRSEHEMHVLFRASAFGRGCTRIVYEPQEINLFAECVKS